MLAERGVRAMAELIVEGEERQSRKKQRTIRKVHEEESERSTGGEESSEDELGARDDTKVRRIARSHPGALMQSTVVMMLRQIGDRLRGDETEAAMNTRGLAVAYLNRALLAREGDKITLRCEREMRTLAEALDALAEGRFASVGDILAQRLRALEASVLEDGGWTVARHLEVVPDSRATTVTSGLRAVMAAAERQDLRLKEGLRRNRGEPAWMPESYAPLAADGRADSSLPSAVAAGVASGQPGKGNGKGKSKTGKVPWRNRR